MRKISSILATILTASLLFAGVAQAETCTISNTGPGSTNECVVKDDFKCEVKNDNDIDIDNDNDQTSGSGNGSVSGNTTGGSATSGGASNSNGTKIEVGVTNSGCLPVATPIIPTTPVTPTTPGRGAGQVSGASTTATPSGGGRGAGEQVAAPVGGVGAGTGGLTAPAVVVSLLTAAVGARRLHRLSNA